MLSVLRTSFLALAVVVVFSLLFGGCDSKPSGPVIRIGYMNCNSEAETMNRFMPLTRYLEKELGVRFEAVPVDTQDFEERFRNGEFTFTHTNSLLYVILREEYGLQLIAGEQRGQFGGRTSGGLIALKKSGIKSIEDMRGKRLLFGPQMAPSGYLAQYDLMLRAGFDPERELSYYAIPPGSFKHEKVIYGVYFGEFDVAAAPMLDLEEMVRDGKVAADDFEIIAQSEPFPYCTFGASAEADPELVERFRRALLDLSPEDTVEYRGERLKVLKSAWVDGFVQFSDADYDPVREMARRVNMPPYQTF